MIPIFYLELSNGEYLTIAFVYSKILPIDISKREQQGYAAMMHEHFTKSGKKIGHQVDGLTIQTFRQGQPPSILNVGGVSVSWEVEKNFLISMGK